MKMLTRKFVASFLLGAASTITFGLFFGGVVTRVEHHARRSDRQETVFDRTDATLEGGRQTIGHTPLVKYQQRQTTNNKSICLPRHRNIICIKVHKAASTTTAAILERYGWRHNLTLAVKQETQFGPHILSSATRFKRHMVYQHQRTYNMITNHVRYGRAEMDIVVPNATYMTIIRHPVKHFESAFAYFKTKSIVNLTDPTDDPISAFMATPEEYWKQKFYFWYQLRSGQIFDLGLDHVNHTGEMVAATIQQLDRDFDLVMIADYFDESLLLLKQHLCLGWSDILYIPDNFRPSGKKRQITEEISDKIKVWNWADMALYEHFNRTFWNRVKDYGADFESDLDYFRSRLKDTLAECTENEIKKKPGDAHGVLRFVMRENATDFCRDLLLGDVEYTKMFRDRQSQTLYNLPKNW